MQDAADLEAPPRLTSLAHGGGCGCKLAPGVLEEVPRHVVRQQLGAATPSGFDKKRQRHEKADSED